MTPASASAEGSSRAVKCRVAVGILNWNGEGHLKRFLPSVLAHTHAPDRVVVIDNGSTDGSLAMLGEEFPEVHVVKLKENSGFAGGYNRGFEVLSKTWSADWFLLLNSDVEVTTGWVDGLCSASEEHGWSAAQPKIRAVERRAEFEYAGAAGGYMDRHGFMFCAGRMFGQNELDLGQYDEDKAVFWASGAALLIRTKAWFEVRGLDEDFFAHMEEIDLCWRLKNRGFVVGATGRSHVYHLGGGTLQHESPKKAFLNFRNNLFLLLKNDHRPGVGSRIFVRQCLDGLAALRFVAEGKWTFFKAVWDAHMAFRRMRKPMRVKRMSEIKACKGVVATPESDAGQFKGSVVWAFFARGAKKWSDLPSGRFS